MPTDADKRLTRVEQLRHDTAVVEAAAKYLRHEIVQQHYAGLARKELTLRFAHLLDVLAIRLPHLDDWLRREVVSACEAFDADVAAEGERRRAE